MSKTVLIAHVPYQVRGGEDIHVAQLKTCYENMGFKVIFLPEGLTASRNTAMKSFYSLIPSAKFPELDQFLEKNPFDFIHLNNAFPFLGPRFFRWVEARKKPMIMTLHNHRFFCTNGLAIRNNKNCRDCFKTKIPLRSLLHNCNSDFIKSIYHTIALADIRRNNLFERAIKYFIAPSRYIENLIVQYGVPRNRVVFILHPGPGIAAQGANQDPVTDPEFDIIYAGRLSVEKGIQTLIKTVEQLPDLKFLVVGDGPEAAAILSAQKQFPNLTVLSGQTHAQTQNWIRKSRVGILPSICNEILSLFALEIFVARKYCIVSDSDSMQWLAGAGLPVRLAHQGDAHDFAAVIRQVLAEPQISDIEYDNIRRQLNIKRFECDLLNLSSRLE